MGVLVCLLAVGLSLWTSAAGQQDLARKNKCERITIPMCQDMPYNLTRMPNIMGQTDQNEAAIKVHEFFPLVEVGCSKHLKFFLCSLFAPMCTEQVDVPIPSCQSICEEVKSKCSPVLQSFHFNWPAMLDCSRLPVPEKNGLCMEYPNVTEDRDNRAKSTDSDAAKKARLFSKFNVNFPGLEANFQNLLPKINQESLMPYRPAKKHVDAGADFVGGTTFNPNWPWDRKPEVECPSKFVSVPVRYPAENICAPRCDVDVYFTRDNKNIVQIWMGTWAAVCFVSTLFTVCTFWIDTVRFRYPERPIIFLSMCSCISSVAYLLRVFAGPDLFSCDHTDPQNPHLVVEGLDSSGCVVVFLLLYFFGTASSVWWVVLTITWYLAACRKWGHEAIESKASYFHVMAWAFPAGMTITLLTLRHVEADELTGLCYVGSQNSTALLYFVIVPMCLLFVVGCVFLILGLVSLVRIRQVMKHVGRNIDKLERLMVRIGLFSVLYTVPCACLIACFWYEQSNWPTWKNAALTRTGTCRTKTRCHLSSSAPSYEIFMVKIFMSQLLGITTGVWVWSNKTWNSWGKFFSSFRRHGAGKTNVAYHHPSPRKPASHKKPPAHVTRV